MSARSLVAGCLSICVLPALAHATTIHVPADQPSIADALAVAVTGDVIIVDSAQFDIEPVIDWQSKSNRVVSTGGVFQPTSGSYRLGPGASIETGLAMGNTTLSISGELRSPSFGSATALARRIDLNGSGRIFVQSDVTLNLTADDSMSLAGAIMVQDGGVLNLSFAANQTAELGGEVILFEQSSLTTTSGLHTAGAITSFDADVTVARTLTHEGDWLAFGGRLIALSEFDVLAFSSFVAADMDVITAGRVNNAYILQLHGGSLRADAIFNQFSFTPVDMVLSGVTISADLISNEQEANLSGYGDWTAALENQGYIELTDDTTIHGDVINGEFAAIEITNGSLTIYGDLFNDGTIIGDVISPFTRGTHTVLINGDGYFGPNASLSLAAGVQMRVRGDVDNAIADNSAFNLAGTTVTLDPLTGSSATFECMSRDIGPYESGLDRTHPGQYPLGTLSIAGSTVNLVDNYDNDIEGEPAGEAVYVNTLSIAEGATLNTQGHKVYYKTLANNGTVDTPANLIPIGPNPIGDLDGDGHVTLTDLGLLLGDYGCTTAPCVGDVDNDGATDLTDLGLLLSHYGEP